MEVKAPTWDAASALLRVHQNLPAVDGVRKFRAPSQTPALDLGAEVALLPLLLRSLRQQSQDSGHISTQVNTSFNLFRFVPSEFIERHDALLPRLLLDLLHQDTVAALEAHAGHLRRAQVLDPAVACVDRRRRETGHVDGVAVTFEVRKTREKTPSQHRRDIFSRSGRTTSTAPSSLPTATPSCTART